MPAGSRPAIALSVLLVALGALAACAPTPQGSEAAATGTPAPAASPAAASPGTAAVQDPPAEPAECALSAAEVGRLSGRDVAEVRYGEFGGGGAPGAGGTAVRACLYDVDGGMIVVADAIRPDDPETIDIGLNGSDGAAGILTMGGCSRAAGELELGDEVFGYLVWSGEALRGAYFYRLGQSDPDQVLPRIARAAGMC